MAQLPSGEARAVLTIATTSGDYVLDNRRNEVLPWRDADLTWVARQSSTQTAWTAIGSGKTPVMLAAR